MKYIEQIHTDSRSTYGSPRVHAELTLGLGLSVNRKRVARLMRQAGIQGLYRRRRSWTTVRDPTAEPAPDLANRHFTVHGPDRLWITDITEHPTEEGKVYCAAVMDAYSRLIIGWSIDNHMRTELVTNALGMATIRGDPLMEGMNPAGQRPANTARHRIAPGRRPHHDHITRYLDALDRQRRQPREHHTDQHRHLRHKRS